MHLTDILNTLTYIALFIAMLWLGKWAYRLINPKINIGNELLEKDNLAFGMVQVGYYAGLLAALGGVLIGPSQGILFDSIDIGVYGLLSIVLLNLSALINDKLVFHKFSIKKEVLIDQNKGTGLIEGANYLATGLMVHGAVMGQGGGIVSTLVFWSLAQVGFVLAARVYALATPYDIHAQIEKDNVAVGIGYSGALIAMAYLFMTAIKGDLVSYADHLTNLAVDGAIGFLFLPLARWATDKVFFPTHNLTDEIVNQQHPNLAAGLIEAFAYIGGAVLIGWLL